MGYSSRISGDLEFTRRQGGQASEKDYEGLSPQALAAASDKNVYGDLNYFFELEEEGAFATGETAKSYDLLENVTSFVALADEDGVDVNGVILIKGEDSGDVSRIVVTGSTVKREQAKVVIQWTDGTTEGM